MLNQDAEARVGALTSVPRGNGLCLMLLAAIIFTIYGGKIEVGASVADVIDVTVEVSGYHIGGPAEYRVEAQPHIREGKATATLCASDHPKGMGRRSGETHYSSATGRSLGTPWAKAAERASATA